MTTATRRHWNPRAFDRPQYLSLEQETDLDRDASRDLTDRESAQRGAARVNKSLVSKGRTRQP
jgi:hypothetical protein